MWLVGSPCRFESRAFMLCTSPLQADIVCNGTQGKKALLSDNQLFDAKFEELATELTERDLQDPGLADALNRLKQVYI